MEANAEKSTSQAAKPAISRYQSYHTGGRPRDRSPFELARDAEEDAAYEVKRALAEKNAQAERIATLLAWAKQKGLVPAEATELPDGDAQLQLVAKAGLSLA